MALRPRQVRLYKDRCRHYRQNTAQASNGEPTFTLLTPTTADGSGLMIGKHFTRPNFDTPAGAGGGISQGKSTNIFTSDEWHCDLAELISAEDIIEMVQSPNVSGGMVWFRVAGEPICRGGIVNATECYLTPCNKPVII